MRGFNYDGRAYRNGYFSQVIIGPCWSLEVYNKLVDVLVAKSCVKDQLDRANAVLRITLNDPQSIVGRSGNPSRRCCSILNATGVQTGKSLGQSSPLYEILLTKPP